VTNLAWQIVGTGDFDGDGRFDVLWRNASTGANVVWRSGNYETQWSLATTSSPWKVAAIGDFDGNGRSDIVWRHTQNGTNLWWKAGESADYQMLASVSDQAWQVAY
jgi:peptidyl-Asp metalloendopeptidase